MRPYKSNLLRSTLAALLLPSPVWAAQSCNTQIPASTPDNAFTLNADGTVLHTKTGLTWTRCSAGQSWNGNTCTGTATAHTWQAALQLAQTANSNRYLGATDWRLPNLKELASIVEQRCFDPAINTTVFPGTPSDVFWSASVYAPYPNDAWFVLFNDGSVSNVNEGSNGGAVRLVRGGQSLDPLVVTPTPTPPVPTPAPVIANEGYIEGWVYDACSKKPIPDVDVNFGDKSQATDRDGHYRRKFAFGTYTVKVAPPGFLPDQKTLSIDRDNNPNGYVTFTLAPPGGCAALKQSALSFKAIIVAGSGPYIPSGNNHIWNSTQGLADKAYTALRVQGYDKDRIRYLSADGSPRDVDKDGGNDVNGVATLQSLGETLTQWAGDVQDVVLYMIGHGGIDSFQLQRDTVLTSAQLKPALDALQAKIPGVLTVVLDSCYSGSFIGPLAAPRRYVVTSTREDRNAVISNDGSNSFSYHFWDQVGLEFGSLSQAFSRARQAMSAQPVEGGKQQDAAVDADGSGAFAANDKDIISPYCFGRCNNGHLAIPPVIEGVGPGENLGGQLSATLRVTTSQPVTSAWANIQRPDYHFPRTVTALADTLQVKMQCNGNHCQGDYRNFNVNDDYVLTFYAQNAEGSISQPLTLKLNQTGIPRSAEKRQADAIYEASTGILTLKDVLYAGQHYYVELRDQGGYQFAVSQLYGLSEAAAVNPAQFDGSRVTIPKVFADANYAVTLKAVGDKFALEGVRPVP